MNAKSVALRNLRGGAGVEIDDAKVSDD